MMIDDEKYKRLKGLRQFLYAMGDHYDKYRAIVEEILEEIENGKKK